MPLNHNYPEQKEVELSVGQYEIKVYVYSDSEITDGDIGTGINSPSSSDSNFQIFPNPAGNLLYIVPSNSTQVLEWKIFSLQG